MAKEMLNVIKGNTRKTISKKAYNDFYKSDGYEIEQSFDDSEEMKQKAFDAVEKNKADDSEAGENNSNDVAAIQTDDLTRIHGVGDKASDMLKKAGYYTFSDVANARLEDLDLITARATQKWIDSAIELSQK